MYAGTTDLDNHVAQYKERMFTTMMERDLVQLTYMTSSLVVYELTDVLIDSFTSLTDRFVEQFASSINLEKIRKKGEPLHSYVGRFNKENVSIPSCVTAVAIS